jgi:hypothetical protein
MLLILAVSGGAACARASADNRRAVPSYDTFSGRLIQLSADQNGDGRLDQWTYLDGNRVLRGEADIDGDGRIDRWEYFDANAQLTEVGTASLNDGVEDTWAFVSPVNGETRVARSRGRDHRIDRNEYLQGEVLVHSVDDTNGDGRADRWDRYANGVLREVDFDLTFSLGRATRRVLYGASGHFEAVEDDSDGDGTFVRLSGTAAAAAQAGVKK